MTFFITLLALIAERFLHWSQLRHWNWFSRFQSFLSMKFSSGSNRLLLAITVLLPVIIVGLIEGLLSSLAHGIPKLIFCVLVLMYCFGPSNFWAGIYSCMRSLNQDNPEVAMNHVKTTLGIQSVGEPQSFHQSFTRAIFVAAHQQIFAVIFWFVILGPMGAVLYRTMSLCATNPLFTASLTAQSVLALLNWLPARLFGFFFALVGHFSKTFSTWKAEAQNGLDSTAELIGNCGMAALNQSNAPLSTSENITENEALALVDRVFILTLVILAVINLVI